MLRLRFLRIKESNKCSEDVSEGGGLNLLIGGGGDGCNSHSLLVNLGGGSLKTSLGIVLNRL